jgi:hypothetical protein
MSWKKLLPDFKRILPIPANLPHLMTSQNLNQKTKMGRNVRLELNQGIPEMNVPHFPKRR